MKSALDRIQQRNNSLVMSLENIDSFEINEEKRARRDIRSPTSTSRLLPKHCLFCKKNKYVNRRLEKLLPCVENRAVESIRRAAIASNDFHILILASQDLIAMEAKYRATCYKSYTKTKSNATKESDPYKILELFAFMHLRKL